MSATDELIKIFDGFGFPSWLMHTMPAEEVYPESFFTFMDIDSPFAAHYDNGPHVVVWSFWIGFYSSNPALMQSVPMELARRLMAAGWVMEGLGEAVKSDEPTHTGRRFTAHFIQRVKKEEY